MTYDVFLSHATEDKEKVALPLMDRLERRGLSVWLDEFELTVGDSLRRSIDKGLSEATFGVVILSPSYLHKVWTNRELDGLVARDDGSRPMVLPVWHNLTREEVLQYSPTLADKVAVSTERGLDYVSEQIVKAIERRDTVSGSKISSVSLSARKAAELAELRRHLLTATSRFDLEHLLYKVDEFLLRYPGDPEARMLRGRVRHAQEPPLASPVPPSARGSRLSCLPAIVAILAVLISLVIFRACPKSGSPNPGLQRTPSGAR